MTKNETGKVILELKSVEQIGKVHARQVYTYLKLKGLKLGFVLNFGANLMKDGIERVVCGLAEENLCVLVSLRETKSHFNLEVVYCCGAGLSEAGLQRGSRPFRLLQAT